ncbi:response regulator [soil metagenome]
MPLTSIHIAVLDDETEITLLLANYLQVHGFRVSQRHTGRALLELMRRDPAAVVLLDLGLPGEDGITIARQLREQWQCGLVIVTGRGDAVDKVVGLEIGADDYVTKPFDLRELLARIRAVLRRTAAVTSPAPLVPLTSFEPSLRMPAAPDAPPTLFRFSGWTLDVAARRLVAAQGDEVPLTTGEFDLLRVMAENTGRVLSRDFLLERTRGRDGGPFDRTIDVQIGRLRRKLGDDPNQPRIVKSVRGAGYLFVPDVVAA